MRFKRPKSNHFSHYCYECKYYTFVRQVGCAYEGVCGAIKDEPSKQDAYDPLCGLFQEKRKKKEVSK